MRFGFSEECLAHDTGPRHPETADRLRAIREGLRRRHDVQYVDTEPATMDTLTLAHDREYIESVQAFCAEGGGQWDPDTHAVPETWDAIKASVGLACDAVDTALAGVSKRNTPFSLGRPPGHHAIYDDAMGFCFANNIAIAAEHAIQRQGCDSIAIIDWDVHHGNGTQEIFFDRGDVMAISLHEHGLYPGTGPAEESGIGSGAGTTLNCPMRPGASDADYLAVFDQVIEPILTDFNPDILLISAGFDAHQHDPISRVRLSTEAYACFTDRLNTIGEQLSAPLAFILEGGYALEVLADSVGIIHETFDGREPIEPDGSVSDNVGELIETITDIHDID